MESNEPAGLLDNLDKLRFAVAKRWQKLKDDSVPHLVPRWGTLCLLLVTYLLRVYFIGGWYIVSYALGIYLLNLLIDFLSPLEDPEFADEAELPTKNDDEYKPFIRKLPEFELWYNTSKALFWGLFCTFFDVLDIPVFWPILLMYFLALFVVSIKARIQHMIKHKYVPISVGKPKFSSKD